MDFVPSEFMPGVRSVRPLVHHMTNYVTINDCANVCICAGGSPVMSDSINEVEEMVSSADVLVLNIGTLNERQVESMEVAGKAAKKAGKPVILDPVGVGATDYRTEVTRNLIESVRPDVIKSNMGEMSIITGCKGIVRGVDSVSYCKDLTDRMLAFSKEKGCIMAVTGKNDYVTDGKQLLELSNGVSMLGNVSGTGCMATSVIGVYVGACGASVESVASAISAFNIAAEDAFKNSVGPGTFKTALMDSLYALKPESLDSRINIRAF